MTVTAEFIDQCITHAEAAKGKMAEHDIPPTPINYSVWYAYVSDSVAGVRQMLDVLISNKRVITNELMSEIYDRFFASADDGLVLQDASMRLEHEVGKIIHWIDDMSEGTSAFDDSLKTNMGELAQPEGLKNLRRVMENLLDQSRRTHENNVRLKAKLEQSSSEIHNLRENLESVQKEALTDALTGIPNRKQFDLSFRNEVMEAMEEGTDLSLALVDIDFFKKFNDTYGHQVGDKVLKLVAQMLSSNIKGRDLAARYGGEEFVLLLPRTSLRDAFSLCEQIRSTVETKVLRNKQSGEDYGKISISIGIGQFDPGETLESLVERADKCLYQAKESGRNRAITEKELLEQA